MQWKRKYSETNLLPRKTMNTLPIPHPAYIAIGIYNRDSDDPIPLDDNICQDILKALEECNPNIQVGYII